MVYVLRGLPRPSSLLLALSRRWAPYRPQQAVGRRADCQSEPLAADLAALCPGCCGDVQNAVQVKCLSNPAPFKHKEDKQ